MGLVHFCSKDNKIIARCLNFMLRIAPWMDESEKFSFKKQEDLSTWKFHKIPEINLIKKKYMHI